MYRGFIWLGAGLVIAFMALLHSSHAIPFYPSVYTNSRHKDYLVEVEDPDAVLEMLAKLGQSIIRAQHEGTNAKRGLDLGLARGFSGSQAAKHLMGLAAANFAAGPGKKKRGDMSPLMMSSGGGSTGRGDLTYGPGGVQPDYLTVSPGASSSEWILNKEK